MRIHFTTNKKRLYVCAVGMGCFLGVVDSLLALQSSINVREGIGPTSALFFAITGTVTSLLICPILLRVLRPKWTLICGALAATMYTLANFYPNWYTMIMGSVLLGFGDSTTYVASSAIVGAIGEVETGPLENMSVFVGIYTFGQVVVSLCIKFILRLPIVDGHTSSISQVNDTRSQNFTFTAPTKCGALDCPAEYSFQTYSMIFEVLVPSQITVYVLLSTCILIQVAGIFIHWVGLSGDEQNGEETTLLEPPSVRSEPIIDSMFVVWRNILNHLLSGQGILVLPVYLLDGLAMSFFWNEFTRAYVSCSVGVQNVGICAALFFFFGAVSSFVLPLFRTYGVFVTILTGFILNLANYAVFLFWIPTTNHVLLPYIMAGFFGLGYGALSLGTLLTSVIYFSDHKTSLSIQKMMIFLGFIISFSWSVSLCVYIKLYIMTGFTIIAILTWGFAHAKYRKFGSV